MLLQFLLLLLIVAVADRTIGRWLERMFYKQTHGDDQTTIYTLEKANEDILVFGSSRASHHYVATDIEGGCKRSCFNCGRDNMSLTYINAVLPIIYARTSPKVVIIDILPTELEASPGNAESFQRIATVLLPFLHRYPALASTIELAGHAEYLKAKASAIYPYNSLVASIVQNAYTRMGHGTVNGYEALYGTIDSARYLTPTWKDFNTHNNPPDDILTEQLQHVIDLTKQHNTRLITIISPFYFKFDFSQSKSLIKIKELLSKNQCELYDFSVDSHFLKKPLLFNDDVHLNDSGAHIFTSSIIDIINARR